ncbi:MAG: acyltransferase, partial [Chitinophagaceae bacterium]
MNPAKTVERNVWVDYLRSAITVLVVAHHASLAYTTFASFDKSAYINSTNPVVDTNRSVLMDIFENFNDIFFMFLMFFIGGLFIARSVGNKGAAVFVKDRLYRLLLPFLIGGTLLMLLAYYPSFILAYDSTEISFYIKDFFTTQQWPVGPPWFIWLLFVFNLIVALLFPFVKSSVVKTAKTIGSLQNRPFHFFMLVFVMTWLLYVPVAFSIGAGTWTGYGPFDFQLSRVLAYFGYFTLGVITGATDFNNQLFARDAAIIKNWKGWALCALFFYATIVINSLYHVLENFVKNGHLSATAA